MPSWRNFNRKTSFTGKKFLGIANPSLVPSGYETIIFAYDGLQHFFIGRSAGGFLKTSYGGPLRNSLSMGLVNFPYSPPHHGTMYGPEPFRDECMRVALKLVENPNA